MTRELVLGILLEVTRDGEYSHIALRNVLTKYQYLDKRERAFITRVTEGTLEYVNGGWEICSGKQNEPRRLNTIIAQSVILTEGKEDTAITNLYRARWDWVNPGHTNQWPTPKLWGTDFLHDRTADMLHIFGKSVTYRGGTQFNGEWVPR